MCLPFPLLFLNLDYYYLYPEIRDPMRMQDSPNITRRHNCMSSFCINTLLKENFKCFNSIIKFYGCVRAPRTLTKVKSYFT